MTKDKGMLYNEYGEPVIDLQALIMEIVKAILTELKDEKAKD